MFIATTVAEKQTDNIFKILNAAQPNIINGSQKN